MHIRFTKAHGAMNDFLLSWQDEVEGLDLAAVASAICQRHTGIGADGWLLLTRPGASPSPDYDVRLRLINPDGGEVEMSGNGTRCAAAWAMANGFAGDQIRILTGGGLKHLRRLGRDGDAFDFAMNMGKPIWKTDGEDRVALEIGPHLYDATIVNVGNPQCAVFVTDFDFDWRAVGAAIERHPLFPQRTNVSFVRHVDGLNIQVRFFERGVGETMSSGTGSTGAAVAAMLRGIVGRQVTVHTPAGPLELKWPNNFADVMMSGPAVLIGSGEFYFPG
jgi:diaminopimelate epimerase